MTFSLVLQQMLEFSIWEQEHLVHGFSWSEIDYISTSFQQDGMMKQTLEASVDEAAG